MPTSVETATAAVRTLKLAGKEYHISPLTEAEWGEYFAWVKDEWLGMIKRQAADLPPDVRTTILKDAFTKFGQMTMTSPEARSITESPQGMYRLIWLSLRRRHPEVTLDMIGDLLFHPEMVVEAMAVVERANVADQETTIPKTIPPPA